MRKYLTIFSLLVATNAFPQKTDINSGQALIEAMYARYKNKWYPNVTFAQQAIFYKDGKVDKEEIWYEAVSGPNGLVIKLRDLNGGDGVMYAGDSQYVWRDNKLVTRAKRLNELYVLGFTVYNDQPDITIAKLRGAGCNFEKFAADNSNGRKEYVVGEEGGPRFWIDREKLLFTRLKKKDAEGHIVEMQFNNYKRLEGGWIAAEVVFLRDGEITFREIYRDIKASKKLPFDFVPTVDFSKLKW